ncbi:MAG TPA: antibiotic biosynthesis monooxygenase [Streptosporangiaceae bacterium]
MPEDTTPFALVVRFTVRAGSEEAFDRLVAETASGIREREYDTLIYACHTVEGQPRQRIFYELYRNRAAFEEHEAHEHVRRFLAERTALLGSTEVDFLELQDGKTPPGFQLDAIVAGTQQRIQGTRQRARILRAVLAALDDMDAVRALVEASESPEAAESALMDLLDIGQAQAGAVLHMPLLQNTPLRRRQIGDEYDQAMADIADLESILASPERLREVVGTERGADLARYDERRWARTDDDDWPGPPLGGAAGRGA